MPLDIDQNLIQNTPGGVGGAAGMGGGGMGMGGGGAAGGLLAPFIMQALQGKRGVNGPTDLGQVNDPVGGATGQLQGPPSMGNYQGGLLSGLMPNGFGGLASQIGDSLGIPGIGSAGGAVSGLASKALSKIFG